MERVGAHWGAGLADRFAPRAFAITAIGGSVYVAGSFTSAGGVNASNIARWNGSQWFSLGNGSSNGLDGTAFTIAGNGANEIYVGGTFETAGGRPIGRIARWDGTRWSAVGGGANLGTVAALSLAENNLYAGGSFNSIGGVSANNIARWDGTVWRALPESAQNGVSDSVSAIHVTPTGEVIVGGQIRRLTNTLSIANSSVVKWDGTRWTVLGGRFGHDPGTGSITVGNFQVASGVLYASGNFKTADGRRVGGIARLDGTNWLPVGLPANGIAEDLVNAISVSGTNVYAGGTFKSVGTHWEVNRIAKWNGHEWTPMGEGVFGFSSPEVLSIATRGTNVYIGGSFSQSGTNPVVNIARWNGAQWEPLGAGVWGRVRALALADNGDLYAGGQFTSAGTVEALRVARWNGAEWSALGSGFTAGTPQGLQVNALAVQGNDLYVGGIFSAAGGIIVSNVARWDGAAWSSLGTGVSNGVTARWRHWLFTERTFTRAERSPRRGAGGPITSPVGTEAAGLLWALGHRTA